MPVLMTIATILFLLGALPMLMLLTSRRGYGPEGPVGAHMVTAPLALLVAIAQAVGAAAGSLGAVGLPPVALYLALPGFVVTMSVAPIVSGGGRQAEWVRVGAFAALLGSLLVLHGAAFGEGGPVLSIVGLVLVGATAAVGYGLLLALFGQSVRNEAIAARDEVDRLSAFERTQSEYQRAEWAKLPADAELWQLIQFAYAFPPEVRAQCRERIAALPDPTAAMDGLLRSGWAPHALRYLAEAFPSSTAPLAEALSTFLLADVSRWERELDPRGNPGSWYANLLGHVDAATRVAKDGGDVTAAMAAWAGLLAGKRGLEPLAARARALSRTAAAG